MRGRVFGMFVLGCGDPKTDPHRPDTDHADSDTDADADTDTDSDADTDTDDSWIVADWVVGQPLATGAADFDGDGDIDLLWSIGPSTAGTVGWSPNLGGGQFGPPIAFEGVEYVWGTS